MIMTLIGTFMWIVYSTSSLLISQCLYPTRFSFKLFVFTFVHCVVMLPLFWLFAEVVDFWGVRLIIRVFWTLSDLCWRRMLFPKIHRPSMLVLFWKCLVLVLILLLIYGVGAMLWIDFPEFFKTFWLIMGSWVTSMFL